MWDRKELKARGKLAMKANYWRCVVAGAVVAMASGVGTAMSGSRANVNKEQLNEAMGGMSQDQMALVAAIIVGTVAVIGLISLILNIFVFAPLEVGGRRFFLVNSEEPAELGELGYGFRAGYLHVVGVMFRRNIQLLLWSMLLFVPGIIKAYSYRMVPYIIAENPEMSASEAISLSRQMMNGQKMNAFLLDLSFIGWGILAALTLGLVGLFYLSPYQAATDAELYRTLRG